MSRYKQAKPTNGAIIATQGALFALALNALLDTTFQTVTLLPTLQPLILVCDLSQLFR